MHNLVLIVQIFSAILLSSLVLLQVKGNGFGRAWGGGGANSFTRRGLESFVFKFTFVIAAVFIVISIFSLTI